MSSATSLILLGAAIVAGVGSLGVWAALRRPDRSLLRRSRNEALAAADRYTPAARVSPYGSPDPCADGLSDGERVEAMRALLVRGDRRPAEPIEVDGAAPAFHASRDDPPTTSPMAWNPTLPPYEAEVWELHRDTRKPRVHESDRQHITVF